MTSVELIEGSHPFKPQHTVQLWSDNHGNQRSRVTSRDLYTEGTRTVAQGTAR